MEKNDLRRGLDACSFVLDSFHNGILIIDKQGHVVCFNTGAARIFGEPRDAVLGRHLSEVRPETWPHLKEVMETGHPQIGKKISLPRTTIIVNRTPIFFGGEIVGVISVFQDISEYEAILSKLSGYQNLHQELEAIIESSGDGLYVTDGKANTIRVNSAYERITGLSRENLLGKNMKELLRDGIFDYSATLEVIKKKSQVTLMQQVKGNKQVMVTGTPIFDGNHKIALVVTSVRDITELNELRAQLEETRKFKFDYMSSFLDESRLAGSLRGMVVKSRSFLQVMEKAAKVADTDISVILCGESGTGKSMLARAIHEMSGRKDGPFVKINCGAIPDSLMESELFGYEKGAFTGARIEGKIGYVEAGNSGTLFFDEIGELKMDLQAKLLEVIEEKTFNRVGSARPTSIDVRIIAATHRDLKDMMRRNLFREDLYYRLNVIPIDIPPLRQRPEDIAALALDFLIRFNEKNHTRKRLTPEVLDRLTSYLYPGNVRELINILERITILSEDDQITLTDLPVELREQQAGMSADFENAHSLKDAVERFEAKMINQVLRFCDSDAAAARKLGIHTSTLWRKMNRYGLKPIISKMQ